MKKRANLVVVLLLAVAAIAAVVFFRSYSSQDTGKKYVVGIVNPNQQTKEINQGFIEGLAGHGYQEGQNISYIVCEAEDCMDFAIKDMVARQVDLIYAVTTPAVKKAKKATKDNGIPVVFVMSDPVGTGVLKTLARPDGNLTGVQLQGGAPKALERLLAVAPKIKRIFVPVKFDTPATMQELAVLREAGERLGVGFLVSEVQTDEELDAALSSMPDDIDAIFFLRSLLIAKNTKKIAEAAIARRLPTGDGSEKYTSGALISYGPDRFRAGKQASRMAHMILSGKTIADIPAERVNFFFGINLKTAAACKIDISDDLLLQADDIIR